jgi:hypothetical protein
VVELVMPLREGAVRQRTHAGAAEVVCRERHRLADDPLERASRSDYLEPAKAEEFNRARGGVPAALLIDASGDMGHAYGALTANHMYIIDRAGVLVYAGGIDDAETMDAKKVLRSRSHVRPALDDLLAGRPIKRPTTDPSGCSIAYG